MRYENYTVALNVHDRLVAVDLELNDLEAELLKRVSAALAVAAGQHCCAPRLSLGGHDEARAA